MEHFDIYFVWCLTPETGLIVVFTLPMHHLPRTSGIDPLLPLFCSFYAMFEL